MNTSSLRKRLAALLFVASASVSAQTYDLVTSFSPTNNPSGPWSWGASDSFGGRFAAFGARGPWAGLMNFWSAETFGLTPWPASVYALNGSMDRCENIGTDIELCPRTVGFHPGAGTEVSTFRFTAPAAGEYTLDAFFFGQDLGPGTSSQVGVSWNGQLLGSLLDIEGFDPEGSGISTGSKGLRTSLVLAAGDVLDISVGNHGTPYFDATGLRATITASAVPEPGSALLMVAGLGWACLHARGRRNGVPTPGQR